MPNEKKGGPSLSYLEQLPTEELEKLLYQDAVFSRTTEPDPTYIMAIMEVIEKREAESSASPTANLNVDAAWHEFQTDYQGQTDSFEAVYLHDQTSHHPDQISTPAKTIRFPKILRYIVAAVAIFVCFCGAASAFGFNVFQAVADWTAEVFGFADQKPGEEDPFLAMRDAVSSHTSLPVVPKWAPENTKAVSSIAATKYSYGKKIHETFETENGRFYITVTIYESQELSAGVYQKDEDTVIEYPVNEIIHYIMDNIGSKKVAWQNENVMVCIQGDLSVEDLKRMVDSVYKE